MVLLIDLKMSQGLGQPVGRQDNARGSRVPPPHVNFVGRFIFPLGGGVYSCGERNTNVYRAQACNKKQVKLSCSK